MLALKAVGKCLPQAICICLWVRAPSVVVPPKLRPVLTLTDHYIHTHILTPKQSQREPRACQAVSDIQPDFRPLNAIYGLIPILVQERKTPSMEILNHPKGESPRDKLIPQGTSMQPTRVRSPMPHMVP